MRTGRVRGEEALADAPCTCGIAFSRERLHAQDLCLLHEGAGGEALLVRVDERERSIGIAGIERGSSAIERSDLLGERRVRRRAGIGCAA